MRRIWKELNSDNFLLLCILYESASLFFKENYRLSERKRGYLIHPRSDFGLNSICCKSKMQFMKSGVQSLYSQSEEVNWNINIFLLILNFFFQSSNIYLFYISKTQNIAQWFITFIKNENHSNDKFNAYFQEKLMIIVNNLL